MDRTGSSASKQRRGRELVALLLSLCLHLLLVVFLPTPPTPHPPSSRRPEIQLIELTTATPRRPEPVPEPEPLATAPAPSSRVPHQRPQRPIAPAARPARPQPVKRRPAATIERLSPVVERNLTTPAEEALPDGGDDASEPRDDTAEPRDDVAEPRNDAPNDEAGEPTPTLVVTPGDALRRQGLRGLAGLDDAGQDRARITKRVNEWSGAAQPPRTNDPPGYPELLPDEDGNLTWFFYYLVAKIRPDGSVFFEHNPNYRARGRRAGRYCDEIAVGLGQCSEQATVPWPEEWGNQFGRFPEGPIKRWFLRQTASYRHQLAELDRDQRLARTASTSTNNAHRILEDRSLSPAARRRLLFELWDECEEPRARDEERAEAAAGRLARERILELIRRELPRESPEAYTDEELRELNARRSSRQEFRPYPPPGRRVKATM